MNCIHFLVMSPYSFDFLLTSLHIYSNIIIMVCSRLITLIKLMSTWSLDSKLSICSRTDQ